MEVILSGLNPLPINEKLEAEKGIYVGQDYYLTIKELPYIFPIEVTYIAVVYQANDEAVSYEVPITLAVETGGDQFFSLLIPDTITSTFTPGYHYLIRANADIDNPSVFQNFRILNLCCVCYS